MNEGKSPPIGFIADEMLQKLGRFLRIAGYDVLIPVNISDREFARLSHKTGRILLTRDKDLSNMKEVYSSRILSDDVSIQLGELNNTGLLSSVPRTGTRCPECNKILERIEKKESERFSHISPMIPQKVRENQETYFYCNSCPKAFWHGKQWDNLMSVLDPYGLTPDQ